MLETVILDFGENREKLDKGIFTVKFFLISVSIAVGVLFGQQAQPEPAGKASNNIVRELLPDKIRSDESFAQKGSSNRFK